MNFSASVNHYHKILDPLFKWKVLDTKSLQRLSNYPGRYDSFCEILRNLKTKGLINWDYFVYGKNKVAYLTKEAYGELAPGYSYHLNDRMVFHGIIVSNVARSFLENNHFYDCELYPEYNFKKNWNRGFILEPNAVLFGKNKKEDNIAMEVMLDQKLKHQVIQKFDTYARSDFFSCAIFIFNERDTFDTYLKMLKETHDALKPSLYKMAIGRKILLLLKDDLIKFPLDFSEDPLFSSSRERKFCEIILD